MASAQTLLELWRCCDKHRISLRAIECLFIGRFTVKLASADDATVAEMINHIQEVEKARRVLLAARPAAASAPRPPMRPPVAQSTIEIEPDRDDDDPVDLETDAHRYPRPKGDPADTFDVHDNTIGYDDHAEDEEEESFPEPDDVALNEPPPVPKPLVAPAPAETKRPEPSVAASAPSASAQRTAPPRLPLRRPRPASAQVAAPASDAGTGLKPRTGMGFVPTTPAGYADLSPEAIRNATWENPVPMSMPQREAAGASSGTPITASPSVPSVTAEEPELRPIRRPAWLGVIAEEDPPD